jgi:hypothetical protein
MLEFQRFDEMTCAVVGKLYLATERRSFLGFCAALAAGPVHAAVIGNPVKTRTLEVIGDSQAQGLAAGLHRAARGARSAHVLNDAKPGTGLVAPSIFDWPAAVPGLLKAAHPDVAVLMFGANDCMSIRLENGHAVAFGTSTWTDKYRQRATAIARAVKASGARLIWVGNPIARDATYSKNMQVVNAIFADVVSREGGTFIDTWLTVSDGSGNYAGYGRNLAGATERLRLDDGIHFTPSGYDIIAARVMSNLQDTQLASTQK